MVSYIPFETIAARPVPVSLDLSWNDFTTRRLLAAITGMTMCECSNLRTELFIGGTVQA
jgi:hypothetical protein